MFLDGSGTAAPVEAARGWLHGGPSWQKLFQQGPEGGDVERLAGHGADTGARDACLSQVLTVTRIQDDGHHAAKPQHLLRCLQPRHPGHGLVEHHQIEAVRVRREALTGLGTVRRQGHGKPPPAEQVLHELPNRGLIVGQQHATAKPGGILGASHGVRSGKALGALVLHCGDIYDQTIWASVQQTFDMGAVAMGATVYFGSAASRRQIQEVSEAFARAHELGMVTVLWAYLCNSAFKHKGVDYHEAADLTGQANHLAVTIEADIVKQKQATRDGGYTAIGFGKTHPRVYSELSGNHPIDWVRYQVANCYMGRIDMINSGGPSGKDDFHKRARGMGLISGRKAFQKPMEDGVRLLNAIQDVYLSREVTVA